MKNEMVTMWNWYLLNCWILIGDTQDFVGGRSQTQSQICVYVCVLVAKFKYLRTAVTNQNYICKKN